MYLEILAEDAKKLLHSAYDESRRKQTQFSAEHILLSLLKTSDQQSVSHSAMKAIIHDVPRLLRDLEAAIESRSCFLVTRSEILEWSVRSAHALSDLYVNADHVLLGILTSCEQHLGRYLSPADINHLKGEIYQLHPKDALGRRAYKRLEELANHPPIISIVEAMERANKDKDIVIAQADYSQAAEFVKEAERSREQLIRVLLENEEAGS